jgi:hypothetical protein
MSSWRVGTECSRGSAAACWRETDDCHSLELAGERPWSYGEFALDWRDRDGDIVLHFNPRTGERQLVLNTYIGRSWGQEQRVPYPFRVEPRSSFRLRFEVLEDRFRIIADGRLVAEFVHRISTAGSEEHVWWLFLDADEFYQGPGGLTLREYLASLDRLPRSWPTGWVVSEADQEDVIGATVANCFREGCERVYLVDNGSTDRRLPGGRRPLPPAPADRRAGIHRGKRPRRVPAPLLRDHVSQLQPRALEASAAALRPRCTAGGHGCGLPQGRVRRRAARAGATGRLRPLPVPCGGSNTAPSRAPLRAERGRLASGGSERSLPGDIFLRWRILEALYRQHWQAVSVFPPCVPGYIPELRTVEEHLA